jgi:hypothetical protein
MDNRVSDLRQVDNLWVEPCEVVLLGLDEPPLTTSSPDLPAATAAKTMASYGHLTTGLEYRPSRHPLLDNLPMPTDQKVSRRGRGPGARRPRKLADSLASRTEFRPSVGVSHLPPMSTQVHHRPERTLESPFWLAKMKIKNSTRVHQVDDLGADGDARTRQGDLRGEVICESWINGGAPVPGVPAQSTVVGPQAAARSRAALI